MKLNSNEIKKKKETLKNISKDNENNKDNKDNKDNNNNLLRYMLNEPTNEQLKETRDYFFQSSLNNWYHLSNNNNNNNENNNENENKDNNITFLTHFIELNQNEAQIIINYWKEQQINEKNKQILLQEEKEEKDKGYNNIIIPNGLENLVEKIDRMILEYFNPNKGVFIKLSTRSPKDSKTIFKKAINNFHNRVSNNNLSIDDIQLKSMTTNLNYRLIAMSEEMSKSLIIHSGIEAIQILCDSERVAEDLMYAYNEGDTIYPVSIVLREWNPLITPQTEFRGFVWNGKLNCVGQYWHSLYFPHLQNKELQTQISNDLLQFFEQIKNLLPVPNAMLDLAWIKPGEVILIEVNPLMEGLGSFRGSTGLFDYYNDSEILQGKLPFEFRVRTIEEDRATLISHMSLEWRNEIFRDHSI